MSGCFWQAACSSIPNSGGMSFDALAARALDTATAQGAQYADVRFEVAWTERIEVRNAVVASLADTTSRGYGIRALVGGCWGFAASADLSDAGIDRTAARAADIAKSAAQIAGMRRFGVAPAVAHVDSYSTPAVRAAEDVALSERV